MCLEIWVQKYGYTNINICLWVRKIVLKSVAQNRGYEIGNLKSKEQNLVSRIRGSKSNFHNHESNIDVKKSEIQSQGSRLRFLNQSSTIGGPESKLRNVQSRPSARTMGPDWGSDFNVGTVQTKVPCPANQHLYWKNIKTHGEEGGEAGGRFSLHPSSYLLIFQGRRAFYNYRMIRIKQRGRGRAARGRARPGGGRCISKKGCRNYAGVQEAALKKRQQTNAGPTFSPFFAYVSRGCGGRIRSKIIRVVLCSFANGRDIYNLVCFIWKNI